MRDADLLDVHTPYISEIAQNIKSLGGFLNAHLHLDRAGTYHDTVRILAEKGISDGASLSLSHKHALIPLIHASSCYESSALQKRVEQYLERMIVIGT